MRFVSKVIFAFFLFSGLFFASSANVQAAPPTCASAIGNAFSFSKSTWPDPAYAQSSYAPLTVTFNNVPIGNYKIICAVELPNGDGYAAMHEVSSIATTGNTGSRGSIVWNVSDNKCFGTNSDGGFQPLAGWNAYIKIEPVNNPAAACTAHTYRLLPAAAGMRCNSENITVSNALGQSGCFIAGEELTWRVSGVTNSAGASYNGAVGISATNASPIFTSVQLTNGAASGTLSTKQEDVAKSVSISLSANVNGSDTCSVSVPLKAICTEDDVNDDPQDTPEDPNSSPDFALCLQADPADRTECAKCFCGSDGCDSSTTATKTLDEKKFWTAFGCVELSGQGIVTDFLRIGLGLSGGFVLLTILYGAFLLTTSSGEPKRVQEAQERISSAIMGLLFVVFSVIILQFIGVSILHIPGFGGS